MELKKTSESYNIIDTTDLWKINGSVHKEIEGIIRINISANMLESGEYVGNFNYTINNNNNVNVNFDCGRKVDDALFAYGNQLVDEIVAQLESNLNS